MSGLKLKTLLNLLVICFVFSFTNKVYATVGVDWTSLPSTVSQSIKFGYNNASAVAYGNGVYVATGNGNGNLSYSVDGISWTRAADSSDIYTSVTYGDNKFVAVGYAGKAAYSTNGINWTTLPSGSDTGIKFNNSLAYSVIYGDDKFVAVGFNGMASYSYNGIDWTVLPAGDDTGIKFGNYRNGNSITYGNGKFVVVGSYGMASYSTDGINWNILPDGVDTGIKFDGYNGLAVTYGNDKFVAVGESGRASYSTDGINWTILPPGVDTGIKFGDGDTYANSIAYGNGKFVVVGDYGAASYSTDGINWTSLPASYTTGIKFGNETGAFSITYGNNKFIVVGNSGYSSYSTDGINWSSSVADTGVKFNTSRIMSSAYGNGVYVAVGEDGKASYSSDGINWTILPAGADTGIKFGSSSAFSVIFGNNKFIVVGQSGKASYSSDGINWTILPAGDSTGIKFGTSSAFSIAFSNYYTTGNGVYVVVGQSGKASYSSDGINWTILPAGADTGIKFGSSNVNSIIAADGVFVVVGQSGKASYSSDAITWYVLPAGNNTGIKFGTENANSITYGYGTLVIVGDNGRASYGPAIGTFTTLPPGNTTGIKFGNYKATSVIFGAGTFIVVGYNGIASYSTDGNNWNILNPGIDTGIKMGINNITSVNYNNGRFLAVGANGAASYSTSIKTADPNIPNTNYDFTKIFGGGGHTYGNNIAVGDSGDIYTASSFSGSLIINDVGDTKTGGDYNVFITKNDSQGSQSWVRTFGGSYGGEATIVSLLVDSEGNSYTVGYFDGSFDFSGVGETSTTTGYADTFIEKTDPNGNHVWTKTFGMDDGGDVEPYSATIDDLGNLYLTGYFDTSIDFSGIGNLRETDGNYKTFIVKIDSDGHYVWDKIFGAETGDSWSTGYAIALDSQNNIYIVGDFYNTIDFSGVGDTLTPDSSTSTFILKLNSEGEYSWVKQIGGDSFSGNANGITIDNDKNIFIVGEFRGTADFDPNGSDEGIKTAIGDKALFLTKLNSDTSYAWTKIIDGAGATVKSWSVKTDQYGNAYIGGYYYQPVNFNDSGSDLGSFYSTKNGFLTKIKSDGNYDWTFTLGGEDIRFSYLWITGLEIKDSSLYYNGIFTPSDNRDFDFNPLSGDDTQNNNNFRQSNSFVTKISLPEETDPSETFTPGDVLINEISPRGDIEWIELLNTTHSAIDLAGWTINVGSYTYTIPSGSNLPDRGLLTINLPSGTDKLSDSSATVTLKSPLLTTIDTNTYGSVDIPAPSSGETVGRNSDGADSWSVSSNKHKGWFNATSPTITTNQLASIGVTTNFDDLPDQSRAQNLSFEKPNLGKIEFASTLNLTDYTVATWLSSLSSKLDLSTPSKIALNADDVQNLINTQATLTMYNIDFNNPKILVDGVDDNGSVVSNIVYDRTAKTLTFTAAHFTTFTAIENNNNNNNNNSNNSSSSSSHSFPSCNDSKPANISDLFQINVDNTTAKLFFTPLADTNHYHISFSTNSNAEEHGADIVLTKEGVQSHNIYYLKPNTTYYFKVRGQNGCMPGDWSNIMKIKTTSNKNNKISYYKYSKTKLSTTFSKIKDIINTKLNSDAIDPPKTINITPVPTGKIIPKSENKSASVESPISTDKKKCFLWWCW